MYSNYEENKYRLSQVVLEALAWLKDGKDVRAVSEACLDLLESLCPEAVCNLEYPTPGHSQDLLSGFCIVFHQMLPGIATKIMKLLKDGTVRHWAHLRLHDLYPLSITVIMSI